MDPTTTENYTLSLHDALPIWTAPTSVPSGTARRAGTASAAAAGSSTPPSRSWVRRSEENTSELQSRQYLVCRLLLEKKKLTERDRQANPSMQLHIHDRSQGIH